MAVLTAVLQVVYIAGNAYAGLASPFRAETEVIRVDGTAASVQTWIR